MAFTALDALREGYEVYPVIDAIGGTSPEAHRVGLDRVIQARVPRHALVLGLRGPPGQGPPGLGASAGLSGMRSGRML
jgi:hypothetical protein